MSDGYQSPQQRTYTAISESPNPEASDYADAAKMAQIIQRHDYQIKALSAGQQQLQKGVNDATQNPIQQIQQFISDIVVLFGGGELADGLLDFGDLQYILPAMGALFGLGDGPFPVNLFAAAEKFFFGYVVPAQAFADVINNMIGAWMNVFGINPKYIKDTKALITAIGQFFGSIDNILPSLNQLFGALGISAGDLGVLGDILGPIIKLFTGIDLKDFGNIFDVIFGVLDPFIVQLTKIINFLNGVLAVLGFHGGDVVNSPLDALTAPWSNLVHFLGDINFAVTHFDLAEAAVQFINAVLYPVNLLAKLIEGVIPGIQIPGLDASKIISGQFAQSFVNGLGDALQSLSDQIAAIIRKIAEAMFGALPPVVQTTIEDLAHALQSIPPVNILGITGQTIQDDIKGTWDNLVAALTGVFHPNRSSADVSNALAEKIAAAQAARDLSEWNNAVLGIRNNKSLMDGVDETEESTFPITTLFNGGSQPPSISVSTGNEPLGFWRATESAKKGFISWFGKGFTGITALNVIVYKFNYTANQIEIVHTSPNVISHVTDDNEWSYIVYNISAADRIQVNAGDVFGIGLYVTGTGTHTIAGMSTGSWLPDHPTVVPARPAATLASGPPSTVPFGSITYSPNVPWFGWGIIGGDTPPDFFAARTTQIGDGTAGTFSYDIPSWANYIDTVLLSAAGGGRGGDPGFGRSGDGGFAGNWLAETLVRGVDFPVDATTLTFTIGDGGAGGYYSSGTAGGATTRTAIASGKAALVAAGGPGGTSFAGGRGRSPGNFTYNGIDYTGGDTAYTSGGGGNGSAGSAPGGGGGGGSGGTYGIAWAGGPGARGAAWATARQS